MAVTQTARSRRGQLGLRAVARCRAGGRAVPDFPVSGAVVGTRPSECRPPANGKPGFCVAGDTADYYTITTATAECNTLPLLPRLMHRERRWGGEGNNSRRVVPLSPGWPCVCYHWRAAARFGIPLHTVGTLCLPRNVSSLIQAAKIIPRIHSIAPYGVCCVAYTFSRGICMYIPFPEVNMGRSPRPCYYYESPNADTVTSALSLDPVRRFQCCA